MAKDAIREENLRLQRDLTKALEERNRLLRKLNILETPHRPKGSRVLEQRLRETREELTQLKFDHGTLAAKYQDAEEHLVRLKQVPRDFLRRLEELIALLDNASPPAEAEPTGTQEELEQTIQRFNAAMEAFWNRLSEDGPLAHGLLTHDLEQFHEVPDLERGVQSESKEEELHQYREIIEELGRGLNRMEAERNQAKAELGQLKTRLAETSTENVQLMDGSLKLKEQVKQLRDMVDPDMFSFVSQGDKAGFAKASRGSTWLRAKHTYGGLVMGLLIATLGIWIFNYPVASIPRLWNGPVPQTAGHAPVDTRNPRGAPAAGEAALSSVVSAVSKESHEQISTGNQPRVEGQGPALVPLAGGTFRMGTDLYGAPEIERPAHQVQVGAFAMGRFEVTFDEFDAFARATGRVLPDDQGWGRGRRPVINVTWAEARAYTDWLSQQTGQPYRLPTEAEWEYALGAGSTTLYWWGQQFAPGKEICFNCGTPWDNRSTAPVGSATANPFGLQDMGGNAMEWVTDCARAGAGPCLERVVRGGAFNKPDDALRITARRFLPADARLPMVGFRIVREMAPGR